MDGRAIGELPAAWILRLAGDLLRRPAGVPPRRPLLLLLQIERRRPLLSLHRAERLRSSRSSRAVDPSPCRGSKAQPLDLTASSTDLGLAHGFGFVPEL